MLRCVGEAKRVPLPPRPYLTVQRWYLTSNLACNESFMSERQLQPLLHSWVSYTIAIAAHTWFDASSHA